MEQVRRAGARWSEEAEVDATQKSDRCRSKVKAARAKAGERAGVPVKVQGKTAVNDLKKSTIRPINHRERR